MISLEKRGTLTEPLKLTEPHCHYMFCKTLKLHGTFVEEHCFKRLLNDLLVKLHL